MYQFHISFTQKSDTSQKCERTKFICVLSDKNDNKAQLSKLMIQKKL